MRTDGYTRGVEACGIKIASVRRFTLCNFPLLKGFCGAFWGSARGRGRVALGAPRSARPPFTRHATASPARNLQKLSPRRDKRVSGQIQSYTKAFEQFGLNFRLLHISVISLSGESFGRAFSKARGFQRQSLWSRLAGRETPLHAG